MIKVFSATDTVFTTNGNKVLKPTKCEETKTLNDSWTLDVSLPIEFVQYIEQDAIVVAPTKYGDQPFRVNNISVGNRIDFIAKHIGYDTLNYVIDSLTVTSSTASATLTELLGAVGTNPFSSYSDIAGTKTITFTKTTLYDALMTCLAQYGGYLDFDKWQIRLTATMGADRGIVVEPGKNLEDATVNEDWSEVCTTIFPIGKDGLTLTPKTITGATTYDKPYTKIVNFEVSNATDLTTEANAYLTAHALPKVNYKVSSSLQDVYLNDTIQVNASQYTLLSNVLSYTYNTLTSRNEVVEFGNYRRTLKQAFSVINDKMAEIDSKVVAVGDITQQQTELINAAGTYGYCTKTENEMYFHDTIPLSSATNVLRINVAGIGFSTTGVGGTFSTAWTIDGKFNADFISGLTITGVKIETTEDMSVGKILYITKVVPQTTTELVQMRLGKYGIHFGDDVDGSGYPYAYISAYDRSVLAGTGYPVFGMTIRTNKDMNIVGDESLNLTFGALGSSDTNTLSDYREGSFTPVIYGGTSAGTGTYTEQVGRYTKVGNAVHFAINLTWTAHSGSGEMIVGGLPFTSKNDGDVPVCLYSNGLSFTSAGALQGYVLKNSSIIKLRTVPSAGGSTTTQNMDSAAYIAVSGVYYVT